MGFLQDAIADVINKIAIDDIIKMPLSTRAEGGDVMPWNECVFVGYSEKEDFEKYTVARTNRSALDFLTLTFPSKIVKGFELNKSDIDPRENALHLDCCFQPIGKNMAILYKGGFKNDKDVEFLVNYFGAKNIIEVNKLPSCPTIQDSALPLSLTNKNVVLHLTHVLKIVHHLNQLYRS